MSKRAKDKYIKIAKELGYSEKTIQKIEESDHEAKILRILREARHTEL